MCLIVFGYKTIPEYYLVLAANRDEFYERPSQPASFWSSNPGLLAGKDLREGGTWLGVHRSGRFAAVTNYRDIPSHNPDAESRGKLVTGFLKSDVLPDSYLNRLKRKSGRYNGFNLLAGDMSELCHFSNREETVNKVEPGIHGISNALLDTPWPKVEKAKSVLNSLVYDGAVTEENLFDLLLDTDIYAPELLPKTGLSHEMERAVSAGFIRTEDYGTRSSTLLFIRYDGSIRFIERVYQPGTTEVTDENGYDFKFAMVPES